MAHPCPWSGVLLRVVGPHRLGRPGLTGPPVSPHCLMSLRTKVGVKTPLPLAGWGQGCKATGAFSPLHCRLSSPHTPAMPAAAHPSHPSTT